MKLTSTLQTIFGFTFLFALLAVPVMGQEKPPEKKMEKKVESTQESQAAKSKMDGVPAALDFTMKAIDGTDVKLSKYQGNVVLFVNVASKCGYTKQYKQLQELHEEYADQGLSIVGIPCNQFGGQEPGTNKEIMEFCESRYGVEFDMMDKVDVKSDTQCDLYQHLTGLDLKPKGKSEVRWNFEKFILDRNGNPIARFATQVSPDSDEFVEVITKALEEKAKASPVAPASYKHTNSKGKSYHLFSQEIKLKNSNRTWTSYFFAKDAKAKKGEPLAAVPQGWEVSETKSGMLVLKKSRK